jgi:predicted small metal-binding protein
MARIIVCECGTIVRGNSEQELLAGGRLHMASNHPAVAEQITDEELLALSEEEPNQRPSGS